MSRGATQPPLFPSVESQTRNLIYVIWLCVYDALVVKLLRGGRCHLPHVIESSKQNINMVFNEVRNDEPLKSDWAQHV